jgi:hypothetical protein
MTQTSLSIITLKDEFSLEELEKKVSTNDEIHLEIPLDSIGKTQSHLDISIDLLFAIYIGDLISQFGDLISAEMIYRRSDVVTDWVKITFRPIPGKDVAKILHNLSQQFDFENGPAEDFLIPAYDFFDKVESGQINPKLAKIADDCMANYISGDLEDFDENTVIDHCQQNPERMFGFWKCIQSYTLGITFFSNLEEVLVIPHKCLENSINNQKKLLSPHLLKAMEELDNEIQFNKATYIQTNDLKFVFNNSGFLSLPQEYLISNSRNCAQVIQKDSGRPVWRFDFAEINDVSEFYLSDNGEILLLVDNYAEYLFFNLTKIPRETAEKALNIVGDAVEFLRPSNIKLDWTQISDETFEELCYAILAQSDIYNWTKIQRMGKSRSRDQGRDLVVEARKNFVYSPIKKYIIQCKLINKRNSLTGKMLTDIVDTVERFGANGYGIMTNVVIDSTVYNKLNEIGTRKGYDIKFWSKDEIEWFLLRRPDIRKKFFKI